MGKKQEEVKNDGNAPSSVTDTHADEHADVAYEHDDRPRAGLACPAGDDCTNESCLIHGRPVETSAGGSESRAKVAYDKALAESRKSKRDRTEVEHKAVAAAASVRAFFGH